MRCFVMICCYVFNVWPKTTLLLPVWSRDAKMLDTPESVLAILGALLTYIKLSIKFSNYILNYSCQGFYRNELNL